MVKLFIEQRAFHKWEIFRSITDEGVAKQI